MFEAPQLDEEMVSEMALSSLKDGIAAHWEKHLCGAHALAIIEGLEGSPRQEEYSIHDLMALGGLTDLSEVIPALAILAQSEFAVINPCVSPDGQPTGTFSLTHSLK